jgi:hypothetical protein
MTIGAISKVLSFPLSFMEGKLREINFRDKKVTLTVLTVFAGCFVVFCLIKKCFFSASVQGEPKKYNKQDLLAEIEKGNIYALQQAANELKDAEGKIDDLAVMKAAVQKPSAGWALQYASARLQDHDELVGLAVANDTTGRALTNANPRFRENRELVKTTLTHCPNALAWLTEYQDDEEMIRTAIEHEKYGNDPDSLSGYGEKIQWEAEEHTIFKFASAAKRSDLDLAKFAIAKNRRAYLVVSDSLKVHAEIVKLAKHYAYQCRQDPIILNHINYWNPPRKIVLQDE